MQEKFQRIISRMIEKLDEPLDATETTLNRVNSKLGLPNQVVVPAQAKNSATQVIYETVAKAERLHAALLAIEEELMNRKYTEQTNAVRNIRGMEDVPPVPGLPYFDERPVFVPSAIVPCDDPTPTPSRRPVGPDKETAKFVYGAVDEDFADFHDPSRQKGVDYTVMGVTTTKPVHKPSKEKREEEQFDLPVAEKAEVIPWNAKLPISLRVGLPKCRWYIGDNLQFDIEIYNQTTKQIKKMTVTLIKRKEKYALKNVNLALDLKTELIVKEAEIIPSDFPVKPRWRYKGKANFKLPYDCTPTRVVDPKTKMTEPGFIYYVQVRAGVPRHNGPAVILGPLALEHRIMD